MQRLSQDTPTMSKSTVKAFCLGISHSMCLLVSVIVAGVAVVVWFVFPIMIAQQVNQRVTIVEGHATYEQLENLTLPLWKSFYFFNLTNPDKFEKGDELPHFQEVGPYSYREYRTKNITEFSEDQELLTYTQRKLFFFDQDASHPNASESDVICTINIPYITAAYKVMDSPLLKFALEATLLVLRSHIYVCHGPSAIAWNYTDSLVRFLYDTGQFPPEYVQIQLNDSIDDMKPSIIRTGVNDIDMIGQYVQWNGEERLNIWPGDTANWINGTEGLFFRPNLKEGDNLTAFVDDVKRSFDLTYHGKVNHLGLEAYRYLLADHTFYSAHNYSENARWGSWNPEGLFYLGPTQTPVAPIYGSNPYFINGSSDLFECLEGIAEVNDTDEIINYLTTVDVEPTTGANIQLKKALQLNVQMNVTDFRHIRNQLCKQTYYYPVLWLSEHGELTEDFKDYLEQKGLREVTFIRSLIPILFGVLIAVAVILFVVSLIMCCCFVRLTRKKLREEEEPLLINNTYDS